MLRMAPNILAQSDGSFAPCTAFSGGVKIHLASKMTLSSAL
jgi:hypothetical protein